MEHTNSEYTLIVRYIPAIATGQEKKSIIFLENNQVVYFSDEVSGREARNQLAAKLAEHFNGKISKELKEYVNINISSGAIIMQLVHISRDASTRDASNKLGKNAGGMSGRISHFVEKAFLPSKFITTIEFKYDPDFLAVMSSYGKDWFLVNT